MLRLRDSKVKFKDWLVSADGCLYEGAEYSPSMLRLLPSLKIPPAIIERNADDQGYKKLQGYTSCHSTFRTGKVGIPRNFPGLDSGLLPSPQ